MNQKLYRSERVGNHLRTDTISFTKDTSVGTVIDRIRNSNISDQITYFYVTDHLQKLTGILPLRKILAAKHTDPVECVMVHNVVALHENDVLAKAQEVFNKHKFLALPVVDSSSRFLGVIDITVFTGDSLDFSEKHNFDAVFETVGVRASMLRYLTPHSAFRYRFPWLLPTLLSGILCAVLTSFFQVTLEKSIVLAFFITLVLGLGESVSIQTLTITIRQLHVEKPTLRWYMQSLWRELLTAFYLGSGVALLLLGIIIVWKHNVLTGIAIGISVTLSLCTAAFFGCSIPALLHTTRLDPKVAAGPLVLGLSDCCTLLFYFSVARWFLH